MSVLSYFDENQIYNDEIVFFGNQENNIECNSSNNNYLNNNQLDQSNYQYFDNANSQFNIEENIPYEQQTEKTIQSNQDNNSQDHQVSQIYSSPKQSNSYNKNTKNCLRDFITPLIQKKKYEQYKTLFNDQQFKEKEFYNFCCFFFGKNGKNEITISGLKKIKNLQEGDKFLDQYYFLILLITKCFPEIVIDINKQTIDDQIKNDQINWFNFFFSHQLVPW